MRLFQLLLALLPLVMVPSSAWLLHPLKASSSNAITIKSNLHCLTSLTGSSVTAIRSVSRRWMTSTSNPSSSSPPKKKFLLEYQYVDNMAEKRGPYRSGHLELAQKLVKEKVIIAGGAFLPKVDGALFIFEGLPEDVENFVKHDPYVQAGLVPRYTIKEWAVAVGSI